MKKIVLFILLLVVLISITAVMIGYDGLKNREGKSDIAVVLGTTVYPDGTMSSYLKGRVDEALKRYQEGEFPLIMVSGGTGVEGHDEAEVMGAYLISQGVPREAVIIDGAGINTKETAKNLKKIMEERNLNTATIITQFFHIPRTRLALACHEINAPYSYHSEVFNIRDVYSTLREIPAYALYWFRCD